MFFILDPLLGTPGMPIFIDRNPALFHTVLDFLRKGHVNLKDKKSWLEDLLDEAQYYRLYSLTTRIMQHIRNLSLQDLIVTGKHSLGVSSFRLEKTSKQNPEVVCSKHLPGGSPDLHTSRGPKKTRSEGSRVGERFQAAVEHHDMTDSCCYTATANTPSSHRFSDYAPAAVLYDPGPLQFSVDEDF